MSRQADLATIEMPSIQTRLGEAEERALLRVVREGKSYAIGAQSGPEGEAFELAFVQLMGCVDAVSVNTCSSALELAAILADLARGDEVILPAHTFVASAVPFARTGATLRWADIEPDTRLISASSVASLITDRTKVLVVVHLYGLPADMDSLMAVARRHNLVVVEDCAQAPGARYNGRRVGTIGDFGCFSFHSHKNITTLGEGGMLAVRNPEQGRQARRLRWMGNWPFEEERVQDWVPAGNNVVEPAPHQWPGNYCLSEPLAAVGTELLKRLDAINQKRRVQAERFIGALKHEKDLSFQHVPDGCEHVYHLVSAAYDGQACGSCRDDLMALLRSKYKLRCIVQYWPLCRTELFAKFGFGQADVPESDRFYSNMISFPWWSDMDDDLLDDMADRTRQALHEIRSG